MDKVVVIFFNQQDTIDYVNWKTKKKQDFRGGKRKGVSRKSLFSEPTKTVSFCCPMSKMDELKIYVTAKLSEWSQGSV
jgi:hypothetical protein